MSNPTCTPWTLPKDYMGETWGDYHSSGFGRSRDSDTIEESNFQVALAELEKLSTDHEGEPTVFSVRESHWAVGWVEWIAIHNSNTAAIAKAKELCAKREDYPVLDEDAHSQLEFETAQDIWENCYNTTERIAYIRRHRNQFEFTDLRDMLGCVRGAYFCGYDSELVNRH